MGFELAFPYLVLLVGFSLTLFILSFRTWAIFSVIAGILLFIVFINTDKVGVGDSLGNSTNYLAPFTTYHMQQDTGTAQSGFPLRSGSNIFWGERALNDGSILIGDQMNSITMTLDKDGQPTGFFYVGVWNGVQPPTLANSNFIVGQMLANKTLLTTSTYTFVRNDTKIYTIQPADVIGIFYNGGSSGNQIIPYSNVTVNTFDNSDSVRSRFDSATQTWGDASSGLDVRMRIALVETRSIVQEEMQDTGFNDTGGQIKIFFIILSAVFMFVGILQYVDRKD